jgi:copper transport protein
MEAFSVWDYLVGINRIALYISAVLSSGVALFVLALGVQRKSFTVRLGAVAAVIAGLTVVLAIGFGGALMRGGGAEALLAFETWQFAARTTLGSSAIVGVVGALLLVIGFRRAARLPLILGAAFTLGAFLVTGHAASAPPVMVMTPMVGIHLLAAAFWFGALAPLFAAAGAQTPVDAGILMQRFSRFAVVGVALLVASGAVVAWVQTDGLQGLFTTVYGRFLLAKVAAFGILLGLAVYNKSWLTPRLQRGDAGAARRIRRTIAVESVLYVFILGVAAALSLSAPPRG